MTKPCNCPRPQPNFRILLMKPKILSSRIFMNHVNRLNRLRFIVKIYRKSLQLGGDELFIPTGVVKKSKIFMLS